MSKKENTKISLDIGVYYEMPDRTIAYTYGCDSSTIKYSTLNGIAKISKDDPSLSKWKPRKDLYDFPGTNDPRLPPDLYATFDLLYDIKYYSQLYYALDGLGDFGSIRRISKTLSSFGLTAADIEKILVDHDYDFPQGKLLMARTERISANSITNVMTLTKAIDTLSKYQEKYGNIELVEITIVEQPNGDTLKVKLADSTKNSWFVATL